MSKSHCGSEACGEDPYAEGSCDCTCLRCTKEEHVPSREIVSRTYDRRRPGRSDLIAVITSLQSLVGAAKSAMHDRNPNREAEVKGYLDQAHALCVEARSYDSPAAGSRSPWNREPVKPRP